MSMWQLVSEWTSTFSHCYLPNLSQTYICIKWSSSSRWYLLLTLSLLFANFFILWEYRCFHSLFSFELMFKNQNKNQQITSKTNQYSVLQWGIPVVPAILFVQDSFLQNSNFNCFNIKFFCLQNSYTCVSPK